MTLIPDATATNGLPVGGRTAAALARIRSSAGLLGIGGFFGVKVLAGLAIITASANWLPVSAFADFTQFSLFLAYLTLVASGGVVNGVIRQAAANTLPDDRRRVLHAAVLIWMVASILTMTTAVAFSGALSELLTGSRRYASLIVALTACSSVAGLGQLFCGALTGMGRLVLSLSYQAAGLFASVAACLLGLYRADVPLATLGFAAGPMLTTLLSLSPVRRLLFTRGEWPSIVAEAGVQMRFAGAFLVTASVPPAILFGLRYLYRDAFGAAPIAYWLLANRVSDINTQIVGLYLAQLFLPTLTAAPATKQRSMIARGLALCVGVSLLACLGFALVGDPLIRLVFHDRLAGAYRYILGYLFGDAVRSIVSVAMICTLARDRPHVYALIEVTAYVLFAIIFMLLLSVRVVTAPFIAYPLAFALTALLAWSLLVPRFSAGRPA